MADPSRIMTSGAVLWKTAARRLDRAGFAADAIVTDASAGAMTLRSFGTMRDKLARDLTEHSVIVQQAIVDEGAGGDLRLIAQARHGVDGPFGSATHKAVSYRIALDLQGDSEVTDVWQIRDQGHLLQQLGFNVAEWTRRNPGKPVARPEPAQGRIGDPWAGAWADIFTTLMDGDFSVLHRTYDAGAELWLPSGQIATGPAAADQFWLSLRAAIPSGEVVIAGASGQEDPLAAPCASLRWYLTGAHDGWGRYGRPTGAPLCIFGITQVEFGPRGIRREWTTIDDVAVWQQISRHLG